jgi:NADPH-dependent 7-cyano-7-deazaguanine reductase QueF
MSISEEEMIKKYLGSYRRMRTLQEEKKLTIYVRDIVSGLNF